TPPPPPPPPLFPYTTLFRSYPRPPEEHRMRVALPSIVAVPLLAACVAPTPGAVRQVPDPVSTRYINPGTLAALPGFTHAVRIGPTLYVSGEVALDSTRSEEHTSELQS